MTVVRRRLWRRRQVRILWCQPGSSARHCRGLLGCCGFGYLRAVGRRHSTRLLDSGAWRARLLDHSLEALGGEASCKAAHRKVERMADAQVQDANGGSGRHDALRMFEQPQAGR